MGAIINPSIVKIVYEKIMKHGQPSQRGYFLKGVYAAGNDLQTAELSDRFSKICITRGNLVAGEFSDSTQRIKFLNKLRKLYRDS